MINSGSKDIPSRNFEYGIQIYSGYMYRHRERVNSENSCMPSKLGTYSFMHTK